MENLNDVEFGSDKNGEEAPILVAQRYLNIFRQIHVFNKDKREQFDDELLALPQNVLDFFKKLPGGRLLVEHMEDVKTQRGISFVKSKRDDFANTSDSSAPSGGMSTQMVGGSLVMDSSFAETFAHSMAEAFKQLPATAAPVGSSSVSLSSDFGRLFELVAEEIRNSRVSLLDILKETRNVTDSVIASQVSISRILESILSSKTKDNTNVSDLNNRIIASQASITKLLESLYTSSTQKNDEILNYLDVDNKLQHFQDDVNQKISQSMQLIADSHDQTYKQPAAVSVNDAQLESRLAQFKDEIKKEILSSLMEFKQDSPRDFSGESSQGKETKNNAQSHPLNETNFSSDERKKKKKKKKDFNNSAINTFAAVSGSGLAKSAFADVAGSQHLVQDDASVVNGVIHNRDYKHDDDFDNIDLNTPPLEFEAEEKDVAETPVQENKDIDFDGLTNDDGLDFTLPEESNENNDTDETNADKTDTDDIGDLNLDDLTNDDGLDFVLPEDKEEKNDVSENNAENVDDLNLDSFANDDEADFVLPEEDNAETNTDKTENIDDLNLDNFTSGSDLGFTLPKEDEKDNISEVKEEGIGDLTLDDFANNDTPDFSLPEEENKENDIIEAEIENDNNLSLDSFANNENDSDNIYDEDINLNDEIKEDSDIETLLPKTAENVDISSGSTQSQESTLSDFINAPETEENYNQDFAENTSEEEPVDENNTSYDDLDAFRSSLDNDEDDTVTNEEETDEESDVPSDNVPHSSGSRYSAELDRIREALTTDNIDISSLDEPIALDDYSDDENVSTTQSTTDEPADTNDEDWEYEYVEDDGSEENNSEGNAEENAGTTEGNNNDEAGDWEWEYVDENGNPVKAPNNDANDEDWEWEYVEEDDSNSNVDDENKPK